MFSPSFPVTYFLFPHSQGDFVMLPPSPAVPASPVILVPSPSLSPTLPPHLYHPGATARPLFLDSAQFPTAAPWVKDTFPAAPRVAAAREREKKKL